MQDILSKFSDKKILVIGDFILDTYIQGTINRISPEAPIPIVDVDTIQEHLGGAANSALNIKALSANVTFCSVIGNDDAGRKGLDLLKSSGIETEGIFVSTCKSTQSKTRIMAENHAIVRYDLGDTDALDAALEEKVIAFIRESYPLCDAILIADYEKGILSDAVIQAIAALKAQNPKFIAVDSKRLTAFKALYPDLIKPNFEEAQKLLHISCSLENRVAQMKQYGKDLRKETQAGVMALTLDHDGALWFDQEGFVCHEPAAHVAFPQVNGAGDTFISSALLSLISEASIPKAGEIAGMAATIVIQKEHTAFCSLIELDLQFRAFEKLIGSPALLKGIIENQKLSGKKIIFTNGCFDILHSGHIHFLQRAKLLGDILVVGLNSDESVRRLKGNARPINILKDRIDVLSAIGCVDYIIPFGKANNDTATDIISSIKPDVFVKGENLKYTVLKEASVLSSLNIPIRFLPISNTHSTAEIIHKIQQSTTPHFDKKYNYE